MHRQTKIVATLGPATDRTGVLESMISQGVNVARLNFSHGNPEDHVQRAEQVRALAEKHNKVVGILCDLQGPKIRIGCFQEGSIALRNGRVFILDTETDLEEGTEERVGLDFPSIVKDCKEQDILLLDDGRIRLQVEKKEPERLITRVIAGGKLSNRKGINLLGGGLNAPALTDKDRKDIETAAAIDCDYLALSFAKSGNDIKELRDITDALDFYPQLLAKIERTEAVATKESIDEIILASDSIMVARGDLGVELGDAQLVGVQKYLIRRAIQLNRTVITATQMMESMIENTVPTRAEVFDVANAVLDGTDATMLSAETAAGKYPAKVIQVMDDVCSGAEQQVEPSKAIHLISDKYFTSIDESIAYASLHTALQLEQVKLIVSFTESGNTALWISRIRANIPILGVSRHRKTISKMTLWRGVMPIYYDIVGIPIDQVPTVVKKLALEFMKLQVGDRIICTRGSRAGVGSGTDRMQVIELTKDDFTLMNSQ